MVWGGFREALCIGQQIAAMGVAVVAACIGTPNAAADNRVCSTTSCSFTTRRTPSVAKWDFERSDGVPDQT